MITFKVGEEGDFSFCEHHVEILEARMIPTFRERLNETNPIINIPCPNETFAIAFDNIISWIKRLEKPFEYMSLSTFREIVKFADAHHMPKLLYDVSVILFLFTIILLPLLMKE